MRLAAAIVLLVPAVAFAQPVPPDSEPPPTQPQPPPPPTTQPPPPTAQLEPRPPPPQPAQPAPETEYGIKSGFTVELHLETAIVELSQVNFMGQPMTTALTLPQPGIFVGYHGPGVMIGVAVDYANGDTTMTASGTTANEATTTSYVIQPGVRVPIIKSDGGRTELLAQVDIGAGSISTHSTNPNPDPPSITHVRLQLAPALRCWINPTFAVGATVGIRYDYLSQDNDVSQGLPQGSTTNTTTGLFTSLQMTGVF